LTPKLTSRRPCKRCDMKKDFFAGKKVLVMGIGRFGGGADVAKFACDAGAKVTVTDLAKPEKLADSIEQLKEYPAIEYHLGSHDIADFQQADIIVANPAVPPDNEFLKTARKLGKFVTSQINIFFELSDATIVGITGASGKSTTAALAAHLLEAGLTGNQKRKVNYKRVWLSGNIGDRPLLSIIDRINADDLVVLELSSFQTETLVQIRNAPGVSLLTNVTPNHLDRHGTFEEYCSAKEKMFELQKLDEKSPAVSIFNAEDQVGSRWFEKYKNQPGRLCLKFSADDVTEDIKQKFPLAGRANFSNLAAAMSIAGYFGVTNARIKKCLPQFKALPHRLEFVAEIKGVRWYNDSIATTPDRVFVALDAFSQPKIIIAGGYDKHIPFDELGRKIANSKTKAAILIGTTAKKIADAIGPSSYTKVLFADSLEKAVELANQLAVPGDVVLLSPACASYDMFDNFQQRGRRFMELVSQIRS
jgi:UDP-N-acetylmuramoylalanine--D-glutamate ligase